MSIILNVEIKEIAVASLEAIRGLCALVRPESTDKAPTKPQNPRILIDKDGNPTLNFKNEEVLAEFNLNIAKLSKWQPTQDQR